jgi:4-carboxymuconolactone decarboxylase
MPSKPAVLAKAAKSTKPTKRKKLSPQETASARKTTSPKTKAALDHARTRAADTWKSPVEAFAAGLALRHSMWGDGGAEDQVLATDDFMFPMQDYVTRYCFGETWTRPTIAPNIRSMLTLGMLVAQGRPNEIKVHVRGAIANGVSRDEIRDVMLHAMIYCGVPRAVEGFRCAAEVLAEIDAAAANTEAK